MNTFITTPKWILNKYKKFCKVSEESLKLLKNAMMKLNLSARAYDRILKVARTIADLEGTEKCTNLTT